MIERKGGAWDDERCVWRLKTQRSLDGDDEDDEDGTEAMMTYNHANPDYP